eukprot:c4637_g1_i1.p1 GENE.c4637_g1_i1~~c4637_g1_i1.p1  ORF type:complete len:556 (-),score=91.02 c4637_g1_i1:17-1684(-)
MKGLVCVLLPMVLGLAVHREEADMALVDREFPGFALSDDIAGAPGAGIVVGEKGVAHHTKEENAEDPCEDDMEPAEDYTSRDPYPQTPTPPDTPKKEEPNYGTRERAFTCREAEEYPEIKPAVTPVFNLARAQYEGNDRAGTADPSMYEVTDCGCVCGSSNSKCGVPGATTFYSDVPDASDCAQLICHHNQFRKCVWKGKVVSRGRWIANTVKFNSTALTLDVPEPDIPATPSPSPSPSTPHVLTLEESIQIKALSMVHFFKLKFCLHVEHSVIAEIKEGLRNVEPNKRAVECGYSADASPTQVGSVADLMTGKYPNDAVENALAGYDGGSPLAADPTRHATLVMSTQGLIQATQQGAGDLDKLAFELLVHLFEQKLPRDVQCIPGSLLAVNELLTAGKSIITSCEKDSETPIASAQDFYIAVISEIRDRLPKPKKPEPKPAPKTDDYDAEAFAEDTNPPLYPPGAPGPHDFKDPMTMVDETPCESDSATGPQANQETSGDNSGPPPGAAGIPAFDQSSSVGHLPAFGFQYEPFEARESRKILPHPPLVDGSVTQ